MALYEYECNDCKHITETQHRMGESPVVPCSKCESFYTHRIISLSGVRFKGTGWSNPKTEMD